MTVTYWEAQRARILENSTKYTISHQHNTNNFVRKIEKGWDMALNNNLYGNFFIAYGVLYVLDSAIDRDTRIRPVDLATTGFQLPAFTATNFSATISLKSNQFHTYLSPTFNLQVQVALHPATINFK
ncbi:hypothetical protein Pcinc_016747 [Petrolisthes cinctipes]|uniref:Olfactomedin-like domain-containing protein n=1 Tax=Petrolisthes cinctipes TaxID=88211 RepID=A0AAE1KLH1_PETCI|nr:hypothetical protein Pcinc_016747 [Petrolisthes cinctipes]